MVESNSSVYSQTVLVFLTGDSTQAKSLAGAASTKQHWYWVPSTASKEKLFTHSTFALWSVLHLLHYFPLTSLSSPPSIPSVFVILFCFSLFRKVISKLPIWIYFMNFKQHIRAIFLLFLIKIYSILPHNIQEEFCQKYINTIIVKGHKTLQNTHYGEWLERRHRHSILSLEHSEQIWELQRHLDPQLAFIYLVTTTAS